MAETKRVRDILQTCVARCCLFAGIEGNGWVRVIVRIRVGVSVIVMVMVMVMVRVRG